MNKRYFLFVLALNFFLFHSNLYALSILYKDHIGQKTVKSIVVLSKKDNAQHNMSSYRKLKSFFSYLRDKISFLPMGKTVIIDDYGETVVVKTGKTIATFKYVERINRNYKVFAINKKNTFASHNVPTNFVATTIKLLDLYTAISIFKKAKSKSYLKNKIRQIMVLPVNNELLMELVSLGKEISENPERNLCLHIEAKKLRRVGLEFKGERFSIRNSTNGRNSYRELWLVFNVAEVDCRS